jgi:hypothetical protein
VAENGGTVVKETTPISVDIQGHWELLEYALSLARDLAYIAGLVAPINTIRVQLLHQVMIPMLSTPVRVI